MTPYAADRTWIQDKNANKLWLVVLKATFDVQTNGSCRLSAEQVPVFLAGQPHGELGQSSLMYDADLFGLKPCTDVLVHGSAWAPRGGRIGSIDVQIAVGPVKKRLRVFGERIWERNLVGGIAMSRPQGFESMPITYERAFGGWDRTSPDPADHRLEGRNPVGTAFSFRSGNCLGKRLPNVEYPGQLIESWKDRPAPAGLNVVDCAWSPRRELAGTYDENWLKARFPLWAEDRDEHYNNSAPADQQVQGFLSGGEGVELLNLSANGRIAFTLPRIRPVFRTRFGSERVEHAAQLCTVIVEPDRNRLIMAWQTSLVCNHRMDELDETIIHEASHLTRAR
jgi:hypothetical protein